MSLTLKTSGGALDYKLYTHFTHYSSPYPDLGAKSRKILVIAAISALVGSSTMSAECREQCCWTDADSDMLLLNRYSDRELTYQAENRLSCFDSQHEMYRYVLMQWRHQFAPLSNERVALWKKNLLRHCIRTGISYAPYIELVHCNILNKSI